jgi:hypothetical protein
MDLDTLLLATVYVLVDDWYKREIAGAMAGRHGVAQ